MQREVEQQEAVEPSVNGLKHVEDIEKFRRSLIRSAEKLGQEARDLLTQVLLQHNISADQINDIEMRVDRRLARRDIPISEGKYSLNELALIAQAYEQLQETKVALGKLRKYAPQRNNT